MATYEACEQARDKLLSLYGDSPNTPGVDIVETNGSYGLTVRLKSQDLPSELIGVPLTWEVD